MCIWVIWMYLRNADAQVFSGPANQNRCCWGQESLFTTSYQAISRCTTVWGDCLKVSLHSSTHYIKILTSEFNTKALVFLSSWGHLIAVPHGTHTTCPHRDCARQRQRVVQTYPSLGKQSWNPSFRPLVIFSLIFMTGPPITFIPRTRGKGTGVEFVLLKRLGLVLCHRSEVKGVVLCGETGTYQRENHSASVVLNQGWICPQAAAQRSETYFGCHDWGLGVGGVLLASSG